MNFSKNDFFLAALFIIPLLFSSFYVVQESQEALLLRLGKLQLIRDTQAPLVEGPGLHVKIPFITQVHLFDARIRTLDNPSSRVMTLNKVELMVDYYAKWRINNLALFYTRTSGNDSNAETLLRQQLDDDLRAEFGKRDIIEVISEQRGDIMAILRRDANMGAKQLGIEVLDVRIRGIELPDETKSRVFERMRAERTSNATMYRAEGRSEAEAIRAKADTSARIAIANALSQSEMLRGVGDAAAAKIYADAYNADPKFYAFYQSLQAYKKSFNSKKDVLLLQPDSQFFQFFTGSKSQKDLN